MKSLICISISTNIFRILEKLNFYQLDFKYYQPKKIYINFIKHKFLYYLQINKPQLTLHIVSIYLRG